MNKLLTLLITAAVMLTSSLPLFGEAAPSIEAQVRRELVMLPYYQVFDRIEFTIDNDTVILSGEVTRPALKSTAEKALGKINEVRKVVNNIEVLPYSPYDDRVRNSVFMAIYYSSWLNRYSQRAYGPIHIIVRNGDVRLTGTVASESDKNVAGILARGVSGVFAVTNDLAVKS